MPPTFPSDPNIPYPTDLERSYEKLTTILEQRIAATESELQSTKLALMMAVDSRNAVLLEKKQERALYFSVGMGVAVLVWMLVTLLARAVS